MLKTNSKYPNFSRFEWNISEPGTIQPRQTGTPHNADTMFAKLPYCTQDTFTLFRVHEHEYIDRDLIICKRSAANLMLSFHGLEALPTLSHGLSLSLSQALCMHAEITICAHTLCSK